jgi:Cu2+-containing amine oxidase
MRPLGFLIVVAVMAVVVSGTEFSSRSVAQPARIKIPTRLDPKSAGVHITELEFPTKATKKQTAWRVEWLVAKDPQTKREILRIHRALFKPNLARDWVQVLATSYLAEIMVAYTDGTRYYDVKGHDFKLSEANQSDTGEAGQILDKEKKVVGELRDGGIRWKHHNRARRGEELVLWATLQAGNYDYIMQYGFQDDGTITCRMGSTGKNHSHSPGPDVAHMHNACWRLDVDLGGREPNDVYLVKHREPWGKAASAVDVVEPFNNGIEGFADWNPLEFTTLRIVNPKIKNRGGKGNPIGYDLLPLRAGLARHYGSDKSSKVDSEEFTLHDFWVTPYAHRDGTPTEQDYTELPKYIQQGRSIKGKDIVLWYMSSAYHMPRDEDLVDGAPGVTMTMWCGFDFRPRNLFDSSPLFP